MENEAARGRGGSSFSEAHYSPHSVPSADPAVFQTPTLLLPFNPPPPRSAGEEVTRSRTRPHQAICSVTSIKSCVAKEPRGLLTPPTAALMDGAAGWFNSRSAQALQEDLTSLRLNNGPGVDGWVGGGRREEINAL